MSLKVYPPRRATCSSASRNIDQFMSGSVATRPRSTARSGCSSGASASSRTAASRHSAAAGRRPSLLEIPSNVACGQMNARWTVGTASWGVGEGRTGPGFHLAAGIRRVRSVTRPDGPEHCRPGLDGRLATRRDDFLLRRAERLAAWVNGRALPWVDRMSRNDRPETGGGRL